MANISERFFNRIVTATACGDMNYCVREVIYSSPLGMPHVYPHVRVDSSRTLSVHATLREAREAGAIDPDYYYVP